MAIIKDLPFDKYVEIDAVNKSTLDLIDKSPALVKWSKECPEDTTKENAGVFGNAFHTLVLEPGQFESRYVVFPKFNLRTNVGKAEKAEFIAANKGRIFINQDDMHKLKLMQASVMAHPEARRLIELSEKEVSFHCQRDGYSTKSRHDILIRKSHVSCDLKSLDPGNKEFSEAWGASVEKRRYDVQAAHYNEDYKHEFGCDLKAFYFIVVSKSLSLGKYECRVMKLSKEQMHQGQEDRTKNIKQYNQCIKTDKWPGIETTIIPAYAKRS